MIQKFNTGNLPDLSQAVVSETEFNRYENWLQKRSGKFTSSNIYKLMTYEDKNELPKGAITYIEEVVIDILTNGNSNENFISEDMERGNEKELEAIGRFESDLGFKCYATGENQEFVEMCSYFGGTPDGLIDNDKLIEVKCPKSKTHFFYLRNLKTSEDLKKHCPNYYWQMQANLLATGRKSAFFISYDDRFLSKIQQILVLNIERNEKDIENLKNRLQMAETHKNQLLNF